MSKKKLAAAVLVLTLVCSMTADAASNRIRFYTGGDQGVYYSLGNALADVITDNSKSSDRSKTYVKVKTSGGSQDNLETMDRGRADLALVQSDVMAYAYNGARLFANGGGITCFSTIGALYSEEVQIVTCDPDIKTVEDLRGRTVSIGASGSGVYYNAIDILDAYDMTEMDIDAVYESFGESSDSLADGSIDAAFIVAGIPTSAVSFLAESNDVYLVSLDEEHIEKLVSTSPYYSETIIPADCYGLDEDTVTVDVDAVLVVSDEVAEDDAYNITAGIFENLDTLAEAHEKGAEINLEMATSVTTVPYAEGAAEYYAEQGIEVPTK